ncbi:hypothetical protein C8R45DRAFT_1115609 [Mycena sanguinolenta]|nr:hypothetical protein C8R45DRAFT_1115609 [Mycena sanguinolenta]
MYKPGIGSVLISPPITSAANPCPVDASTPPANPPAMDADTPPANPPVMDVDAPPANPPALDADAAFPHPPAVGNPPPCTSQIQLPLWEALVQQWCALETATNFETTGKVLSACGRPDAVSWWVQHMRKNSTIPPGLDSPDGCEDFYESVVKWWISVNPAWRADSVSSTEAFVVHGLKQESDDEPGTEPP